MIQTLRYYPIFIGGAPSRLVQNSFSFILRHFTVLRCLAASSMGAKELIYNRPRAPLTPLKRLEHVRTIREPIMWVVKTIWLSHQYAREFFSVHGVLFLTSGAAGLWGYFFRQRVATAIGEGALVLANVVALKYHITLYLNATERSTRTSAVLGILSNLGYIVSHAMLLIGFHASIAFVICCLALSMGGLKIFYDILQGQAV